MAAKYLPQVLVVEDSPILALEYETLLKENGYGVVGPCSNVEKALVFILECKIDVALLDVHIQDTTSFAIAAKLREKNIPFMFLSGSDGRKDLPEEFLDEAYLTKPSDDRTILETLERISLQ